MCGVAGAIDAVEGWATARAALLNDWQRCGTWAVAAPDAWLRAAAC